MTPETLAKIMPYAGSRISMFAQPLTEAMAQYGISSPHRQASFLGHTCHESGSLKYVLELATGDAYEGRKDLGNTQPGDGRKYKGRGLIQITGRVNYMACGQALKLDLINDPAQLELPRYAAMSAAWFWNTKGLNELADDDKFGTITKIINGGYNGLDDRIQHWLRARKVLGL